MDRYDKTRFAYTSPLQPYLGIWGVFWTTFFILVNGFTVFYKWDVSKFLTSCTRPFVGLFPSQFFLTWVSRHQHPDLHRPLSRLQAYLQNQDPQFKGRRPRIRYPFDGRDRKARDPPNNNLGQDQCCALLRRLLLSHFSLSGTRCGQAAFTTSRKERQTVYSF